MARMIQIRNVPDKLHRELKSRAALSGKTLSDFLLDEIRKAAARPTREDMLTRLRERSAVKTKESFAAMVRRERDAR